MMDRFDALFDNFESRVVEYNHALNTSGIWLFLATLGCWSVTNDNVRMAAFVITFLIFTHLLVNQLKSPKLFSAEVKELMSQIEADDSNADLRDARLHRLESRCKKLLPFHKRLIHLPAYYLSAVFILISLYHWAK